MFALANIKRFLLNVDCFLMFAIKKGAKKKYSNSINYVEKRPKIYWQLCKKYNRSFYDNEAHEHQIEMDNSIQPTGEKKTRLKNIDSYWVIKKVESFNLLEIIIFYCNRNWKDFGNKYGFFVTIYLLLNAFLPFDLLYSFNVSLITFQFYDFSCCSERWWVKDDGAVFVLCLSVCVYSLTYLRKSYAICIQNKASLTEPTLGSNQFWFWAPTHRSLFLFSLVTSHNFIHNIFMHKNCCYFDNFCTKFIKFNYFPTFCSQLFRKWINFLVLFIYNDAFSRCKSEI